MKLHSIVYVMIMLFVAFVLEHLPLPAMVDWFQPAWVMLVVTAAVLAAPSVFGVWLAIPLGLMLDVEKGTLLGLHVLLLAMHVYLLQLLYRRMYLFNVLQQAAVLFLMVLAEQIIHYWSLAVMREDVTPIMLLAPALTTACSGPGLRDWLPLAATHGVFMILASSSPRRRELLTQIGDVFVFRRRISMKTPLAYEGAVAYVERMALEKARKVAEEHPQEVVLGSDTSVIFSGEILGKPVNNREAEETLQRLSGQTHQVLSAVAVVKGDREKVISVATEVTFRSLSDEEIARYVATGEPADKAGSYGIQGMGAILVAGISGSYSNVVGLPLTETAALLNEF